MAAVILVFFVAAVLVGFADLDGRSFVIEVVATPLTNAILVGVGAAGQAAIYHELIRIKEGGGAVVADVFS
jgi:hypothetical protein